MDSRPDERRATFERPREIAPGERSLSFDPWKRACGIAVLVFVSLPVLGLLLLVSGCVARDFRSIPKEHSAVAESPDGRWVASLVTANGWMSATRGVALAPASPTPERNWIYLHEWPWPEVFVRDLRWIAPERIEVDCSPAPGPDVARTARFPGTPVVVEFTVSP